MIVRGKNLKMEVGEGSTRKRRVGCKISGCTQRGRYNYGIEYFYHGFCKDHYSLYQEGIIDLSGNSIRLKLQGCRNISEHAPMRQKYVRWKKEDHVKNHLRCKISNCYRDGELNHGKRHFPRNFCSFHYRECYLKGIIDIDGNIICNKDKRKNRRKFVITPKMVKECKRTVMF